MAKKKKDAFLILFEKIAKKGKEEDPFSATEENIPSLWESCGNEKVLPKKGMWVEARIFD